MRQARRQQKEEGSTKGVRWKNVIISFPLLQKKKLKSSFGLGPRFVLKSEKTHPFCACIFPRPLYLCGLQLNGPIAGLLEPAKSEERKCLLWDCTVWDLGIDHLCKWFFFSLFFSSFFLLIPTASGAISTDRETR